MSAWDLPTSIQLAGKDCPINTDFRAVLDILKYFKDPNYDTEEQWMICLDILYKGLDKIPSGSTAEAAEKARAFIDMDMDGDPKAPSDSAKSGLMDWEQDARLYIPAVNKVLGMEVRSVQYMHWWTFLGAYMEIGDGLFSNVLHIRSKRKSGKKLEKWEQKFFRENQDIILLREKYSDDEKAEQEQLLRLLDRK